MIYEFLMIFIYIFLSFFLFDLFRNFQISHLPFFSILILLFLFIYKKETLFKILSIVLSLTFIFISYLLLSFKFFIPLILIFIIWLQSNVFKNNKVLFILNLFCGFFLFLSISSFEGLNLINFLISLHFALPFSQSLIKNTLYFKEPEFPYGHFISVLFGVSGIGFVIFRIYSFLLFIPLFILLSISIYATLYQPPYKKSYPAIYQLCIFSSMILNYFGLKL